MAFSVSASLEDSTCLSAPSTRAFRSDFENTVAAAQLRSRPARALNSGCEAGMLAVRTNSPRGGGPMRISALGAISALATVVAAGASVAFAADLPVEPTCAEL